MNTYKQEFDQKTAKHTHGGLYGSNWMNLRVQGQRYMKQQRHKKMIGTRLEKAVVAQKDSGQAQQKQEAKVGEVTVGKKTGAGKATGGAVKGKERAKAKERTKVKRMKEVAGKKDMKRQEM